MLEQRFVSVQQLANENGNFHSKQSLHLIKLFVEMRIHYRNPFFSRVAFNFLIKLNWKRSVELLLGRKNLYINKKNIIWKYSRCLLKRRRISNSETMMRPASKLEPRDKQCCMFRYMLLPYLRWRLKWWRAQVETSKEFSLFAFHRVELWFLPRKILGEGNLSWGRTWKNLWNLIPCSDACERNALRGSGCD